MTTEQLAANLAKIATSLAAMGAPATAEMLLEARTKLLAYDGTETPAQDRIWVSEDRTVLVNLWAKDDTLTFALRGSSDHVWGPPRELEEETTYRTLRPMEPTP